MTRAVIRLLMIFLPAWALAGEAVIDARSGRLIAGVEAEAPRAPASVTKLMTIHLALEAVAAGRLSLDDALTVSAHAAAAPPVRLGLKAGDRIPLRTAVHAALVLSSNDAARAIAEAVAGSETAFAARMTEEARRLGLTATVFRNASGLPAEGHVSTAHDMARLALAVETAHGAELAPLFRAPVVWNGRARRPRNGAVASVPGAVLGKTGFTCAAGYTAALVADGAAGRIAVATAGHDRAGARAATLARLAKGRAEGHRRAGACGGAPEPAAPPAPLTQWALTLGVFSREDAARKRLALAADFAPGATPALGRRPTRAGVYALMLVEGRADGLRLVERLGAKGLGARLIGAEGGKLLDLRLSPVAGQGG